MLNNCHSLRQLATNNQPILLAFLFVFAALVTVVWRAMRLLLEQQRQIKILPNMGQLFIASYLGTFT
jgi:hypothetical protein